MQPEKYPSDAAAKFMLRLPDGMRERIAEASKANGRSMNSEIVARLQTTFDGTQPKTRDMPSADEIADKVMERLVKTGRGK